MILLIRLKQTMLPLTAHVLVKLQHLLLQVLQLIL